MADYFADRRQRMKAILGASTRPVARDRHVFRSRPRLRRLTHALFHDGSAVTLAEAVRVMPTTSSDAASDADVGPDRRFLGTSGEYEGGRSRSSVSWAATLRASIRENR